MVAKTRPVLILSVAYDERERAVLTFAPSTTSVRYRNMWIQEVDLVRPNTDFKN